MFDSLIIFKKSTDSTSKLSVGAKNKIAPLMSECIDVFQCQQGFHLTYMKTAALFDQHNLLEKVVGIDDIDNEFCKLHCPLILRSLFKKKLLTI